MKKLRAPREEIFKKLREQLGPESITVVAQVVTRLQVGEIEQALSILDDLDRQIGGIGLYKQRGQKLPGVYRPLTYVDMVLRNTHREQFTRSAVHASCGHVEAVLKTKARLGFFENLKADKLPLGTIVEKIQKQLPPLLYDNLVWFSKGICNPAKHDYVFDENFIEGNSSGEHLFDLDEAIAVYLIARKLVVDLEDNFGVKVTTSEDHSV